MLVRIWTLIQFYHGNDDVILSRVTWIVLPGMDGTGELLGPFVAQIPKGDVAVVVRYPKARVLSALIKAKRRNFDARFINDNG
jgi:hypothetical protein